MLSRKQNSLWQFQMYKQVSGCILSPCLLNLYAENIIRNTRLNESRLPGEKLTTSDMQNDTTLMAQGEEELKSLLMRVKERE